MSTEDYIRGLIKFSGNPVLSEQREYAAINNIPVLLPETANLLELLTRMNNPSKILEIGTAIGYSGLLMLSCSTGSELVTIELDEETLDTAKAFFSKAGMSKRVTAHLGDAKLIVPMLSGTYDMIFLDGPKSSYIEFLPYLYKMLKTNGILVCDNVLYKGWISGENMPPKRKHDTIIRNMDAFCRAISGSNDLVTSVLPIGDGLSVSYKK